MIKDEAYFVVKMMDEIYLLCSEQVSNELEINLIDMGTWMTLNIFVWKY
jgi:hypothetical protein